MKVKVIENAVLFISQLTLSDLNRAKKFTPEATTLYKAVKDSKSDKAHMEPVFSVMYNENDGFVNANGIVFDSVTTDDHLLKSMTVGGEDFSAMNAAEREQVIAEQFANIIMLANETETQILAALDESNDKINAALNAIETLEIN